MNLYASLIRKTYSRSDLPGRLFDLAKPLILSIRNLPVSLKEQDELIDHLIDELNADEQNPQPIIEQYQQKIHHLQKEHKGDQWKSFMDFFLFAPLWLAGYQGLLCGLMEGKTSIEMGWGNLLQVIGLYVLVRWVVEAAVRYPYGWKRWVMVLGFFVAAMGITWLSDQIPGSFQISVIALFVICIIVFAAAYIWHRSFFASQPLSKEL